MFDDFDTQIQCEEFEDCLAYNDCLDDFRYFYEES